MRGKKHKKAMKKKTREKMKKKKGKREKKKFLTSCCPLGGSVIGTIDDGAGPKLALVSPLLLVVGSFCSFSLFSSFLSLAQASTSQEEPLAPPQVVLTPPTPTTAALISSTIFRLMLDAFTFPVVLWLLLVLLLPLLLMLLLLYGKLHSVVQLVPSYNEW